MSDAIMVRAASACRHCGARHVVDVVYGLIAKDLGTFSLAGVQIKVPATEGWFYRCTNCGATGAEDLPVDPERLRQMPVLECGHRDIMDPWLGEEHQEGLCPGCCPHCQRLHDASKSS